MRTGLFITARLKSTRLPLKLLARIQGKEVIRHVIERAKQVSGIDRIVLCTSTNPQDMPLTDIAIDEGISYFCGDPDDVLVRLKDAANFFNVDSFISVTADNPLFCIYHANQASEAIRKEPAIDYLFFRDLPIGAFVYALRTKFLDVVCEFKENTDTEIWGPYVNRPELFNVKEVVSKLPFTMEARLTLDKPEDLWLMSRISRELGLVPFSHITLYDIYDLFLKNPELRTINDAVEQSAPPLDAIKRIDELYKNYQDKLMSLMEEKYY